MNRHHRRRTRGFYTVTLPLLCFFAFTFLFAAYYIIRYTPHSGSAPVIECSGGAIYSTAAEAADTSAPMYFTGISATDAEDGDLSGSVVLESISGIIDFEKSVIQVNYAVCDSDGNVGKLTRELYLTDYTRPVFSLSDELAFPVSQTEPNLGDIISAYDRADGDISSKIRYTPDNFSYYKTPGLYYIEFAVSNSVGDTVTLSLPVRIYDRAEADKKVTLSEYIVYKTEQQPFDFMNYSSDASVSANVPDDIAASGTHYVTYSDGSAYAVLTVVVN